MEALPVVDVSDGRGDDRVGRALVASGFALLEGHGLAPDVLARAERAATRAFALPEEVKARYRGPLDGSQRGWQPVEPTRADGGDRLDRKEAFHLRAGGHRHASPLPAEEPDLEPALRALLGSLERVAARVLRGLDAFVGQPAGHFGARVAGGDSLLRVNRYPGADVLGTRERFRPHRDYQLITLVAGASAPGLEIRTPYGAWLPVPQDPSRLVLNAGNVLEVESGGRIPSTTHRVAPALPGEGPRLSFAFFVGPRPEVVLANGVSAGAFVGAQLREAGYG